MLLSGKCHYSPEDLTADPIRYSFEAYIPPLLLLEGKRGLISPSWFTTGKYPFLG
jgi:hypothetical protein